MAKTNTKAVDTRFHPTARLAGGMGQAAAVQDASALLRRAVLANLLWEKTFYEGKGSDGKVHADKLFSEDGQENAANIAMLVPLVSPQVVADLAVEARTVQKLRHVPLFLALQMLEHPNHKGKVAKLLPQIVLRPDEMSEILAMYWKDHPGRPLASQLKKGLARAFQSFDAYQLAKWNRPSVVKLVDVMRMVRPKPQTPDQEVWFKQLRDGTLPTPDTWEVALSGGEDKKAAWTRLIQTGKLPAFATLKNLANMEKAGVEYDVIREALEHVNPQWLLPLDFVRAADNAPRFSQEIEALMLKTLNMSAKLPGYTILIVDVSGSMRVQISGRSEYTRLDTAAMMTMLAAETCERVSVYVTAGSDSARKHKTQMLKVYHGFGVADAIRGTYRSMGGGGIFTRQALEYVKGQEHGKVDRIIVFSDSQDCDIHNQTAPAPFGKYNYIVDVSAERRGINYKGVWTAEVSGWSEGFIKYIAALEGIQFGIANEPEDVQEQTQQ